MVIGFELLGTAAFALFTGWLFLIIRLSQGPMDVDFLTKNIEMGLNSQQTGFEFNVGSTLLTWGGATQPFEFEMKHVQISRADKTPVLSVEKIGLQLSKRYLVFGRFVPQVIKIYSPALRVIRVEDGSFLLNVSDSAGSKPAADAVSQADFMKTLLTQMKDKGAFDLLAGLEQIAITNAAFLYEDKIWNVIWKSRNSDITFTRRRGGLSINSITNVEMDQDHQAYVHGSFYYNWQTSQSGGVVYFTNFNPALLAQQSAQLKNFSGIDLPLKGSVSIDLDRNFKPGRGRFVLGAEPGRFNAFSLYHDPIPIKSVYMQGRFDMSTKEAVLEQFRADLDGPKLEAKAEIKKQGEARLIQVGALLQNMPLDRLKGHWPEELAPAPRAWVTGHLSAGNASRATLSLSLLAPQEDFKSLKLQKVGGQIDFNGVKADYLSPMMPVTKISGRAVYDNASFNIDVAGGALGDMQVTKSKVSITGIDSQDEKTHAKIDINATVNGPLHTALKVLDSEPLQYLRKLGIQTAEVAGDTAAEVELRFPLHNDLTLQDIKVTAQAKLKGVGLKNIVSDLDLAGGAMELSIDGGAMTVKGAGALDGMPVEFKWLKNFSKEADVASRVEAKLPLDAPALAKFGVPDDFRAAGTLPADVTYTVAKDDTANLVFKGDITPTAFTAPLANYEKKPDLPGTLDLIAHFDKLGRLSRISGLHIETKDALLKGAVEFGADGKSLKKAAFSQVRTGDTDIALAVDNNGKEGYVVKITGRQFDASAILGGDDKPNSDAEAARPVAPMTVSMAVDRFATGQDKYIEQVKMFLRRNGWSRIEQLDVDGSSGGKPLSLHYLPVPLGHTLRFEAYNAGAALRALGITNGMRGGSLVVNGQPTPKGGLRDLQGSVVLTDFSLVNIPALGRLLNAMSLSGIVELLNGKGVAFKKMRANFQWTDRGQPETARNIRLIRLRDGETSGASLGLTFEGNIDNWSNILDIDGTIIPVSDLNKLVGIIPLVGPILTGGGKGVFAATYSIKGPHDQPTVTVNPLSVLAPGIFRKLFFEK